MRKGIFKLPYKKTAVTCARTLRTMTYGTHNVLSWAYNWNNESVENFGKQIFWKVAT
jgi:hypothetical protein